MTPRETVILTRYIHALCPQQAIDEFTADAWHDVLGRYEIEEARAAAVTVASRQPFVAPSEIIAEIRRLRETAEAGDRLRALLDPVAYRAQVAEIDSAFMRKLRARMGEPRAIKNAPGA